MTDELSVFWIRYFVLFVCLTSVVFCIFMLNYLFNMYDILYFWMLHY